jgi:hypothetical protein
MNTRPNDADADPEGDDGTVVIELEDGAALMYSPDNPRAWIRTDAPVSLDATA